MEKEITIVAILLVMGAYYYVSGKLKKRVKSSGQCHCGGGKCSCCRGGSDNIRHW